MKPNPIFPWLSFLAFAVADIAVSSAPAAILSGDTGSHDPSRMVFCDGKYYVYSTGGSMKYSTDGINWTAGLSPFPAAEPPATPAPGARPARRTVPPSAKAILPDNRGIWAPDVIFYNDKYYLYYSVAAPLNTGKCLIGLLTSPTLDPSAANYKWTDAGVVLSTENRVEKKSAIDPGPFVDARGDLWMVWGSGYANGATVNDPTIIISKLDNATGLRSEVDPTYYPTIPGHIEAGYVHYRAGYYYLFWNDGGCCNGIKSTYRIHVARSETVTGPYVNKEGREGGEIFMATDKDKEIYGPGHMGILTEPGLDRFSFHYYNSSARPVLGIRTLLWGGDGWPTIGEDPQAVVQAAGVGENTGVLSTAAKSETIHLGPFTLEAESATLAGNLRISTEMPGYYGDGFVTGIKNSQDVMTWNFKATPGLYRISIRFQSVSGQKGFDGMINEHGFSGMFSKTDTFEDYDAGLVEVLPGSNTLQIGGGWSFYDIDRVTLTPAKVPPPPLPVSGKLSDPQATTAARNLMASLVRDYGKFTWSGQHDSGKIGLIEKTTGRKPVIVEGDLIDYSPSRVEHGSKPRNYTEQQIALAKSGHVLALLWHWNAPTNLPDTKEQPWWFGFYTRATTFDFAAALDHPESPEYALLVRDIDVIAAELKKVSDQNIPVLWRPLHEASGGHFWWGAKGPEPFKALWRLLYDRLTVHHKLHNLIWVLTNIDPKWYPGNDVVDILGVDSYPKDPADSLQNDWLPLIAQFNGVKPIALTEFGGIPDIERMYRFGVRFAYFSPWNGEYIEKAPADTMTRIYQSPEVITLDELKTRPPTSPTTVHP